MLISGVVLLHDSVLLALEHRWSISAGSYVTTLLTAPYSPDLAPSDYHLFMYLKNWLKSQCLNNNKEFMKGVKTWPSSQVAGFFDRGIQNHSSIQVPQFPW
jgi:hypothetical protein